DAWRRVTQVLYGREGSVAALQVRTVDGANQNLSITRTIAMGQVVTLGNLPPLRVVFESRALKTPGGANAGLIAFNYWLTAISDQFERAIDQFRQSAGIAIDLRGNPGGLAGMIGGIAGHVIEAPDVLGTMRTREAQLTFHVNPRFVTSD